MQDDRVAQLICRAVSAQEDERQAAEQELRQMETQDGFTAHLMAIGGCSELDAQTRWLAVVYLKNQVARFWIRRTGVPYEIGAHEKTAIRNGCLPLSLDADEKISTQSALVVSRIVRFDYPRVWPDIMPMIAQAVEQNMPSRPLGNNASGVQVTRVLHYCLKELSTKRLVQDRKAFFQVAPAFLSLMLQFWSIHHDALSPYLAQACAAGNQSAAADIGDGLSAPACPRISAANSLHAGGGMGELPRRLRPELAAPRPNYRCALDLFPRQAGGRGDGKPHACTARRLAKAPHPRPRSLAAPCALVRRQHRQKLASDGATHAARSHTSRRLCRAAYTGPCRP